MIYGNVKHQYSDEPVVVLEIDMEGAEYLADVAYSEWNRTQDGGAWDIWETLQEQVDYLRQIQERDV